MERFDQMVINLVMPLVTKPEKVQCKVLSDLDGQVELKLIVDEVDLGRVIGKSGATANSIRTIAQAGASMSGTRLRIEIASE